MSKFSKLAALYLFLTLLGLTYTPPSVTPSWETLTASSSPLVLTAEQEVIASHLAVKYSKPKQLLNRIVQAAYAEGARFGLKPLTLLAIIEKESGFRPAVVNDYGAVGLMQVVPRFHRNKLASASDEQLKTPETNIHVGARILSEYLAAKNGDLDAALKKYSGNSKSYAQRVAYYEGKLTDVQTRARA